ncbi:MAG: glycerol-3-phosphate 1-O-acyltransferase PlsY [Halanaerobiales bacterium]|nr:glycerol-3-phosphate 1-O-acyltransferase PlsY [Halanaerobiales bacterium]
MKVIFLLLTSYLLGSIPTGFIIAKIMNGIDIRQHGSGNTGATNVFRVLGSKAGLITAIGDISKGILVLVLVRTFMKVPVWGLEIRTVLLICALSVISGHNWSIFLGFEGGKGIATTAGVLMYLTPYLFLILIFVFVSIVYLTKYVSLGSIITGAMIPVIMILLKEPGEYILFGIIAAIFVVYRHRGNIERLLAGTENKISKPGKGSGRVR